jgi:hypothetical protein
MPNSKEDKPKGKGGAENLIPLNKRTKEEQREIQLAGGKARGKQMKEQVLMSRIFSDYLCEEHDVVIRDDEGKVLDRSKLPAKELIKRTITGVMAREDSASVAMMKTIGEITEGKNVNLSGHVETNDLTEGMTLEQKKELVAEWLKKNSR